MFHEGNLTIHRKKLRTLSTSTQVGQDIVLCLHGWLDNVGSFVPLMQELPNTPWLAVDLIGHGQSDWRCPENFYYYHEYINDLMIWIENQPDKNIHLVGHSLGAAIASLLAGLLPERISSVVLIDALGPLVSSIDSIAEQWRLSLHQYKKVKPRRPFPSKDILIKARGKKHNISKEACRLLVDYGYTQKDNEYFWSFDPRLLNLSPLQMTQEQVLSILSHVKAPTMLINAISGYPFEGPAFEERKKAIQNFKEHKVEGGHHVHMDNPRLVAKLMLEFYEQQQWQLVS